MKLVISKIEAIMSKTIPTVPEITFVINNIPISAAKRILIILSVLPMFFFILYNLNFLLKGKLMIFYKSNLCNISNLCNN